MSAVKRASSRAAEEKRRKVADSEAVRELAALLRQEFLEIVVTEKFGNLSFSFAGKVMGFTRSENALALKLPAERVRELVEQHGWQPLTMGKRTMREWIVAERGVRGWRGELKVVREAVKFVRDTDKTGLPGEAT